MHGLLYIEGCATGYLPVQPLLIPFLAAFWPESNAIYVQIFKKFQRIGLVGVLNGVSRVWQLE